MRKPGAQESSHDELSRRRFVGVSSVAALVPSITAVPQADAKTNTHPPARFSVNGREVVANVEPRVTLLDFLRDRLLLTGIKKGCNEGACGTCTVLIDGKRMNGCLTLAVQCDGREVTTIEGLAKGNKLHPVQEAFIRHDAFQCGYCTPGQILSAIACISEGHATDPASVREWMSGNICRCAAYPNIVAAIKQAAGTPA
jgi:xanthine dehydrogenase YagT iron-sulfur-binding subunit